ncbi:TPA: UDP-N-acetylglucosamine 2-epimerase (non-hydrolyzing) [Candidatus Avigastranaerophilus faecigallinarum]|nr:UDP-N-acetylglucosamine 2-epimerase (non-hydrolyzing) [Candidatus Avigastranaerophilus faecigallinarum]
MSKIKVLTIFGTRPEAIKMAPLVKEIEKNSDTLESVVCVTAQHRQILDQVLELFEIKPDYDLDIMKDNQNLWSLTSDVLLKTKEVIEKVKPDVVLVHGDTTTSMAAALSAFYAKVPVGHVEAGLRTFNKYYPFPEEINRVFADAVCTYHFAPTDESCENLKKSQIPSEHIYKTGNTVIDALIYTVENHKEEVKGLKLNPNLKTILLTSHRRENFGEPIREICNAIIELVKNNKDIEVVYPVHPNPNVRKPVYELLGEKERIHLIEPLEYAQFCNLMKKAHIILTDSGGVQEEAPSLGKPVLVLRDTTERPEAVKYGTVKLVGANKDKIISMVEKLLTDDSEYKKMSESINPYGDGHACKRIVDVLKTIK